MGVGIRRLRHVPAALGPPGCHNAAQRPDRVRSENAGAPLHVEPPRSPRQQLRVYTARVWELARVPIAMMSCGARCCRAYSMQSARPFVGARGSGLPFFSHDLSSIGQLPYSPSPRSLTSALNGWVGEFLNRPMCIVAAAPPILPTRPKRALGYIVTSHAE
jgi:hypothetical protein